MHLRDGHINQGLNFVKDAKNVALSFGGLNNLITLSLSLSLSLSSLPPGTNSQSTFIKIRGHPRVNIRLFLQKCKGSLIVFLSQFL